MTKSSKFNQKIKRFLLDFDEDERKIAEDKAKTKAALDRLRNKSKSRNAVCMLIKDK